MNYFNTIKNWFLGLSRRDQLLLSLFAAVIMILTTCLCYWTLRPDYQLLFSQMQPQDAHQVIEALDESKVPYRLANQGQDILIPEELVDKTRLQLMGSAFHFKGNIGFELFDRNDFGMTDFSRKINYQRALQGELERTISSLEEVSQARIHLVLPEDHLFQTENNQPQAALTLRLIKPLSKIQIKSIQQLIAASIPHMKAQDIVIVDQNGNNLGGSADEASTDHLAFKKSLEQHLNNKLQTMLRQVYPDEPLAVTVDATLNYDELQRESLQPQTDGKMTHQKEVHHATEDKTKKNQVNNDLSLEKSFQYGTEKEQFKRATGYIEHLSISVALPANTSAEKRLQIENLVKTTVGFNSQRGDSISVEAIIARPTTPLKTSAKISRPQTPTNHQSWIGLALILILLGSGLGVSRQLRLRKQRVRLLNELTLWLRDKV